MEGSPRLLSAVIRLVHLDAAREDNRFKLVKKREVVSGGVPLLGGVEVGDNFAEGIGVFVFDPESVIVFPGYNRLE